MKRSLPLITILCISQAYGQQVLTATQNQNPPSGKQRQDLTTATSNAGNLSAIILQYNGAIQILETGLRNNWPLERYFAVFDESPSLDKANAQPDSSRRLVRDVLTPLQRPRVAWDERPTTNVEVLRVLERLRLQRDLLVQHQIAQKTK